MQATVEFKMDVTDENIKREAMKVVWRFSGVTFVDIRERGILKVRGTFDQIEMGSKLNEIDKSVDIINQMGKAAQTRIPGLSRLTSVYNYLTTPTMQEIVVFKVKGRLDERMKRKAMEVIWEFSGITSVEVNKGGDQLEVKGGEFNKIAMSTKLKAIDENVMVIIKAGPNAQADAMKINNMRTTFHTTVREPEPVRKPEPVIVKPEPVPVRGLGPNIRRGVPQVPAPAPEPAPAPVPAPSYGRIHLPVKKPFLTRCFRATLPMKSVTGMTRCWNH